MRATLTLIRREFTAYFLSPIAYVVLVVFLVVMGGLFYDRMTLLTEHGPRGIEFPMQVLLGHWLFWLVFLLIPPVLTMRLFAEERATGTLELLLTAPLQDWQVVAAKFIGCFAFYLVLWIPTLFYLPVLVDFDWNTWHARIDPWPVITSYIGLAFAGAMFLSLGLFISSLVRSQIVAVLVAILLSIVFMLTGFWRPEMDTATAGYKILYFFSVPLHFHLNFTRGQIDTRHLVLYGSVALFFLFLTIRSLESRRWR